MYLYSTIEVTDDFLPFDSAVLYWMWFWQTHLETPAASPLLTAISPLPVLNIEVFLCVVPCCLVVAVCLPIEWSGLRMYTYLRMFTLRQTNFCLFPHICMLPHARHVLMHTRTILVSVGLYVICTESKACARGSDPELSARWSPNSPFYFHSLVKSIFEPMRIASLRDVISRPETEAPKPPPRTSARSRTPPSDHDDDFDVRRRAPFLFFCSQHSLVVVKILKSCSPLDLLRIFAINARFLMFFFVHIVLHRLRK